MYFRCTSCLAATWIGTDKPPTASDAVNCHECGRTFVAAPAAELGSTEGSHYRHTSSFASAENLDMATAYSFLLGLISRDELSTVEGMEVEEPPLDEHELLLIENLEMEAPPPEVKTEVAAVEEPLSIDPGFQKAVARGRLTVEEALRRGDRTAYATNLSSRYDLSMDLAYAVADNRITLFQARKQEEAKPTPAKTSTAPVSGGAGGRLVVVALVAVAILGLTWGLSKKKPQAVSRTTSTQAKPSTTTGNSTATPSTALPNSAATTYSSTEILTDSSGRMTLIAGLDARTVLLAYCGTETDATTCDPLEIMDTVPPSREIRLGTFRDPRSPDEVRAITIQRDRFSRRWVAGDGEHPIPFSDPPELAEDGSRVAGT